MRAMPFRAAVAGLIVLSGAAVRAEPYFWNGTAGGGGSWTDIGANWATPTAGTLPLVPWVNGNSAVFGVAPGTVTLDSAGLTATGLNFQVDGYVLEGPNGIGLSGALNTLTVGTGTATLAGTVTATSGNTYKYGAGTLRLTGNWVGTNREFSARGGTVEVAGTGFGFNKFIIGAAAPATLNWSGGTGVVVNNYWGVGDGSHGTMTLSGGSLTVTAGGGSLFVGTGNSVRGQLTINGGEGRITGANLWIGAGYNGARTEICTGVLTVASGNLTFAGSGAIKLSNVANQSGTLNLNGGVFTLNDKSITKGAGTAAVNFDGGTLRLSAANGAIFGAGMAPVLHGGGAVFDTAGFNGTLAVPLAAGAGSGGLTKQGAGTLTLSGDNTYAGGTLVSAGTLQVGSAGAAGTLGGGDITNHGTLVYNRSDDQTWAQTISGTGILSKNNAGILTLTGTTGMSNLWINAGTVLNAGAMTVTGAGGSGNDGLRILNDAVLTNGGSITMPTGAGKFQFFTNGRLDNGGPITNGLVFVLSEGGTAGHTVASNHAGGSVVQGAGTFYIGLYYPGTFHNVGGAVSIEGNSSLVIGGATWATTTGSNTVGTLNLVSGLVSVSSSGLLQLGGIVNAPNGTGVVNIAGGILAVNKRISKGAGPDSMAYVNFNGGALSGTVNNVTLLGTDLSAVTVQSNGARVALGAGITNTIAAPLLDGGGGGGLTKAGEGVLRLSGASTYGGDTTVDGGTLRVDNSTGSGTGTGNVLVNAGGTLGGTGAVSGAVTVAAGAKFASGESVGTIVVGGLALAAGSTFEVEADGAAADRTISLGPVDLGGAMLSAVEINPATFTSAIILSNASGQITGLFAGLGESAPVPIGGSTYYIHYRPAYVELNLSPTSVVLHQFVVMAEGSTVVVRWQTASEIGTTGFDLYRKVGDDWVKVNETIIPAAGAPQGGAGASYRLVDPGAAPGGTYEYKLVEYEQGGTQREYGPYQRTASAFEMTSPIRATPAGMEVHWLSREGETYRVLRTTNLLDAAMQVVGEAVAPTPPENVFLDTNAAPVRVYRVELE